MRLIPLSDKERIRENSPFAISTLYKWRSTGEHADLTVRVSGKVCLNLKALDEMVNEGLEKQRLKCKRLQEVREKLKE